MSNVEWMSFTKMRGDSDRTWFRRSDVIDALRAAGSEWTWHDVRRVLARLPRPERRYGHFQYTQEHLDAVLAAAREEVVRCET